MENLDNLCLALDVIVGGAFATYALYRPLAFLDTVKDEERKGIDNKYRRKINEIKEDMQSFIDFDKKDESSYERLESILIKYVNDIRNGSRKYDMDILDPDIKKAFNQNLTELESFIRHYVPEFKGKLKL